MSEIKKAKKEKEILLSELRIHFHKMDIGKRVLLINGRIGIFKGYEGGKIFGDSFLFEEHGIVHDVPLESYDCVLINNSELKCPLCMGDRIMDGCLTNLSGIPPVFRENITTDIKMLSTHNSRVIYLHACRDCGYVLPFVRI